MISAIHERRSIRRFQDTPLSKRDITDILRCGISAPSSKNRQPWKFVVAQGSAKEEMLRAFRAGILREESGGALLPQSAGHIAGAKYTAQIMEQAPAVVFVLNPLGKGIEAELSFEDRIYEICNIQSASASIENMLLAATQKGIGSLWICDIFFAYPELCEWLGAEGELLAAVALGYPAETPAPRPRRSIEEVVEWRD